MEWTEFVEKHHDYLNSYALSLASRFQVPKHLAEDFVQDALSAALTSRADIGTEKNKLSYIMVSVKNKFFDHSRRRSYRNREDILCTIEFIDRSNLSDCLRMGPDEIAAYSSQVQIINSFVTHGLPVLTKHYHKLCEVSSIVIEGDSAGMEITSRTKQAICRFRAVLRGWLDWHNDESRNLGPYIGRYYEIGRLLAESVFSGRTGDAVDAA